MVTAVILINTDRRKVNETAEKLAAIEGVSEVFSVAGRYDLVAMIRAATNEEMADIVTNRLLQFDSIISTETLLAFQAFSKYDLERMFSIGTA